ncbi:RxLR-like protein [Plasmopara halstedii]|uniref:RxLR-like protein n=1 Tax=Plasmopara halstedii TaxID=4781 RepID=A0A0N7L4W8_PLAHL|nr:RxLR-like protein [Plasmopara halstedii]CEG39835.1 RxLR-like protein [Plasmopara halstedii]|eukprot:XP_024576204.1 RxLR-like protein [Plasmopara halstedii]
MHFRYLRAIVLASLLAASTLARTNFKSATSQTQHSSGSQSIDDEFRVLSLPTFQKEVLMTKKSLYLLGLKHIVASVRHVEIKVTPKEYAAICEMKLGSQNLLADTSWAKWAYFVCLREMDDWTRRHEVILSAMKDIFTSGDLDVIFKRALLDSETSELAVALINHDPLIFDRVTKKILAEINRHNFFGDHYNEWVKCIRIQSGDQDEETYVLKELKHLTEFYGESDLVRILTSPKNQNDIGQKYMDALCAVWLNDKKRPDDVMKMVIGTKYHLFNFLYHGPRTISPQVWVSYHYHFYVMYPNEARMLTLLDTLTSAIGPAKVAIMLWAAQMSPDLLAREWALYFQKAQYQEWFAKGLSSDTVEKEVANDVKIDDFGVCFRTELANYVRNEYTTALLHPNFKELNVLGLDIGLQGT